VARYFTTPLFRLLNEISFFTAKVAMKEKDRTKSSQQNTQLPAGNLITNHCHNALLWYHASSRNFQLFLDGKPIFLIPFTLHNKPHVSEGDADESFK
jgi:hypothetical protein